MTPSQNMPSNAPDDANRPWWSRLGRFVAYWLWYRWRAELTAPGEEEDGRPAERTVERGHEGEAIDVRGIVIFSIGLLILIVGTMAVLVGLYQLFQREEPAPSPFAGVERIPPPPRLQQDPSVDLTQWQRQVSVRLDSYGWVDPSLSIVHIPIDRAISIVVAEGLPYDSAAGATPRHRIISSTGYAWEPPEPRPPGPPPYLTPGLSPYLPSPVLLREQLEPSLFVPNWEIRADTAQ